MPSDLLPTLYTFRRCPYAIRARMALAQSGIDYRAIEVSLKAKPPQLIAVSPKATVPVLCLPTGEVIDQSLAIMRWALAQNDPDGWLTPPPTHETPALDMAYWLELCDTTFKPLLDRYKYWNRHPEMPQEAHRERAVAAFIAQLNARLTLGASLSFGGYVLGDRASLADVAIFPFVRQFAAVDQAWFDAQTWPALQTWLAGWLNSSAYLLAMKK